MAVGCWIAEVLLFSCTVIEIFVAVVAVEHFKLFCTAHFELFYSRLIYILWGFSHIFIYVYIDIGSFMYGSMGFFACSVGFRKSNNLYHNFLFGLFFFVSVFFFSGYILTLMLSLFIIRLDY